MPVRGKIKAGKRRWGGS